ncbi:YbaB/EbfC family nucleoid-associated protein [Varunaivibrio sulfuroxidans]|uniref:Nucleoid-associated protein EDD55_101359 n=1 Tax=Varunaivibrio sulfuroxidans TaxID=1773489 RepID=A0A4R3JIC7_9PROT|nr:YbaB/EbfC family nucleoid-associated protein [Varunaivibrio sulfuroxidans]TCS65026.1 hypothetical protein EDD55_101359 [Varunaivibrio sulfuroxidans]WES29684.1 YbaB/EbfC family nucleoid-associated protein [Varunaivibrio sulfuroxidans]
MKNLGQMMKQAQQLQTRMTEMQEKLDEHQTEGLSGGAMVRITLNGRGDMRALKIDPSLLNPDEGEILEDLIRAAYTDAKTKIDAYKQEMMADVTGGLPLPPGFKMPF